MPLTEILKRSAAALRDAGVDFALTGSAAAWARGGPRPDHDVDYALRRQDADRAAEALAAAGFRIVRPPEGWLLKAYAGEELVDLIWEISGCADVEEALARAEVISVQAVPMAVLALEDVLVAKLCSFDEQALDFGPPLALARALRESIAWDEVRTRTASSPYARAFLTLLEELRVIESGSRTDDAGRPRISVVSGR